MTGIYQVWQADIENQKLAQRDQQTFGKTLPNYLFPIGQTSKNACTPRYNVNTQLGTYECRQSDSKAIRKIDVESLLQWRQLEVTRDWVSPVNSSTPKLTERGRSDATESQRTLYRTYHAPEINSRGYPNFDREIWNNTTKALYGTHDTRH